MYTTHGSVCGGCDHKHRTLATAQACADRHHAAIARHNTRGAYSDRRVRRADGAPLSESERDQLERLADR